MNKVSSINRRVRMGGEKRTVGIPTGHYRVYSGKVKRGDMLFDTKARSFVKTSSSGTPVRACACVMRKQTVVV